MMTRSQEQVYIGPSVGQCRDSPAVSLPLQALRAYVESRDYAGYDPYDALNSRVLRRLGSRSKWIRIAFIQFLKRSPLNLRRVLGIAKEHNPKAIGLFLWGYAKLSGVEQKEDYFERIEYLLTLLEQLRSRGYSGNCWGYNFPWQNGLWFVPEYTPTMVNSAFIGHALLDTYVLCGNRRALDMAVPIKDFILYSLQRRKEGEGICFSYTPRDNNYVHNANLLGAALLMRLYAVLGDKALEELALASLCYSLRHQRQDGAWWYAEMELQKWVDSFHTGFNLEALRYFILQGYASCCRDAFDRGVRYYVDNFFLPNGTPKYYDNKVFPIDIHSPCEALVVLSDRLVGQPQLAEKVLRWMLLHMWSPQGYFFYRKGRLLTNRIPYMRWSQAWAFHALTSYLHNARWS